MDSSAYQVPINELNLTDSLLVRSLYHENSVYDLAVIAIDPRKCDGYITYFVVGGRSKGKFFRSPVSTLVRRVLTESPPIPVPLFLFDIGELSGKLKLALEHNGIEPVYRGVKNYEPSCKQLAFTL